MPAVPELPEPLSDGVLALRFAAERDIPEILIAYQNDPVLHERLDEARPPSGAQLGRRCEEAEARRLAGEEVRLTVLGAGDDECVGQVWIHRLEWRHGRGDLSLWLAPAVRGRGLGPRALALAARWLFASTHLERLQVLVAVDNGAMIAAARAARFREEGVLRAWGVRHGRRVDTAVLSLLPSELD